MYQYPYSNLPKTRRKHSSETEPLKMFAVSLPITLPEEIDAFARSKNINRSMAAEILLREGLKHLEVKPPLTEDSIWD